MARSTKYEVRKLEEGGWIVLVDGDAVADALPTKKAATALIRTLKEQPAEPVAEETPAEADEPVVEETPEAPAEPVAEQTPAEPVKRNGGPRVLAKGAKLTIEGAELLRSSRGQQRHIREADETRTMCGIDPAGWTETLVETGELVTCPLCSKAMKAAAKDAVAAS